LIFFFALVSVLFLNSFTDSASAHHRDPTIPFCGDGIYESSEFPNGQYVCHGDNPANLRCVGNIVTGSGSSIVYTRDTSDTGDSCYTTTGVPGICAWYSCSPHLLLHTNQLPGNVTVTPQLVNAGENVTVTIHNPGIDNNYQTMSTTVTLKKVIPGTSGHYLLNFRGNHTSTIPIEWYPAKTIDSIWHGVLGGNAEPLTRVLEPTVTHIINNSRPGTVNPNLVTVYETAFPRFQGNLTIIEPGTYTIEYSDIVAQRIESTPFTVGPPQYSIINGMKFNDVNEDGIFQAGEPGLGGWRIFIDNNTNSVWDSGEINSITKNSTSNLGEYSLTGVGVGQQRVCEEFQSNWIQTFPGSSSMQNTVVCSDVVVNSPNSVISNINFGNMFSLVVNNVNDAVDASGCTIAHCSLREALMASSSNPGVDKIVFAIPGSLPHRILTLDTLPSIDDTVILDGTTQPGYSNFPVIMIDGTNAGNTDGLIVTAGSNVIRGLSIINFERSGIVLLNNGGNILESNYLGVDSTGASFGNVDGISLVDSPNNTIGGLVQSKRNIISGNSADGIEIKGPTSSGNKIIGNYIGTDSTGSLDRGNNFNGISIVDAPNNFVGGITSTERNILSGNDGIGIFVKGVSSTGNKIQGNYIGTNFDGTTALPNTDSGVHVDNAPNTAIGTSTANSGNLISGNTNHGVEIVGSGSTGTKLLRNYIGTNVTGNGDLGNIENGVVVTASTLISVGDIVSNNKNIISGNDKNGILITDQSSNNSILSNYIGTDLTGLKKIQNTENGIQIFKSPSNIVDQNLISGNLKNGILIKNSLSQNNLIKGNLIGTNATGVGDIGNTLNGIEIVDSPSNVVGDLTGLTTGSCTGSCNVISGNDQDGVLISGSSSIKNSIRYNSIHDNSRLGINLGTDVITPNDNLKLITSSDSDSGPNNILNFPVALTSHYNGTHSFITGVIYTNLPTERPSIDIYLNQKPDSSGFGQGQHYWKTIPFAEINSDGTFKTLITGALPFSFISATAVNFEGSTSEFSPVCGDPDGDGNPDSDGDGLCDDWETAGIDFNGDATVDLNLSTLGAQANCKDIFVEIDHMPSHAPHPSHLSNVAASFAAAPVSCPAKGIGGMGINLHYDLDTMDLIPHQDEINDWVEFDPLKERFFGTATQRSDATGNQINAKELVYRYVLFIHAREGTGSSGRGELPGNDFMVSLGKDGWGTRLPSNHTSGSGMEIESTFMHEMGHTLNLRHGGVDDFNCKPNYFSIMSYTLQFNNTVGTRSLDYSRSVLPTLNEASLNEPAGIGASTPAGLMTVRGPPGPTYFVTAGNSVDWNRNGNLTDVGVSLLSTGDPTDINKLTNGTDGCIGTGTVLPGAQDWNSILFNFRVTDAFPAGVHTSGFGVGLVEEMTPQMREEMLQALNITGNPIDITPPNFTSFPNDLIVMATNPSGTVVTYSLPTVVDAITTTPVVWCEPASGTVFPIGTTVVNCTGSDNYGNLNEQSFTVTVIDDSSSTPNLFWIILILIAAIVVGVIVWLRFIR